LGFRLILAKLQELGLTPSNSLQFLTPDSIRIFSQNCSMFLTNDFLRVHHISHYCKSKINAFKEHVCLNNKKSFLIIPDLIGLDKISALFRSGMLIYTLHLSAGPLIIVTATMEEKCKMTSSMPFWKGSKS